MDHNNLFDKFSEQPELASDDRRKLILEFKKLAKTLKEQPEQTPHIAYGIAGLMAADFARKLPNNDPIDEILTIAGELEINPSNANELREELIKKVEALL